MEIGGVEASSPIFLAPLAGVSCETFRAWHLRAGAALAHTEMVSAVGLAHGSRKTAELLGPDESGQIVLQLFGPDEASISRGAEIALARKSFAAIEVNMACPMPKVAKKGSGSALMKSASISAAIVSGLARFGLPVWVKTRISRSAEYEPTGDFVERMFDAGASLAIVHGRTPPQKYEGSADKDVVIALARRWPGRVAASGDVYGPSDAARYLDGGCVAVLAARGAIRDAFIVPKISASLGFDVPPEMASPEDPCGALVWIGRRAVEREGERAAVVLVKRMLSGIFRGFSGAASARRIFAMCHSWKEIEDAIAEIRLEE